MLHPVILSGGSGTRLWPLSRVAVPKQLLPLVGERTLFQETVARLGGIPDLSRPSVVCNSDYRFLIAEQMLDIGVKPDQMFLEPVGRNTAPAAAIAALHFVRSDPAATMLVLPADHLIQDVAAFEQTAAQGLQAVAQGYLVSLGVTPNKAETGYGYILRGQSLDGTQVCRVERFIEKPDQAQAEEYLRHGGYLWNSGIFLFNARQYLEELQAHRPDIFAACERAYAASDEDLDFRRLDEQSFRDCPSDSIDYAVMENTNRAAVVPADMGWSDVGAWSALWEIANRDQAGNATQGDVVLLESENSFIRADSRLVAAIGVRDLLVVESADAVLVADRRRSQDVKKIVEYLKQHKRPEHEVHPRVLRPWGWYENIDLGERFQVKRIAVKPGAALSLQLHHHRAEHWVVVRGTAKVTCGDRMQLVGENESVYIPMGARHRLENPGKVMLEVIEIQTGSYLGEDDIVRFEDQYGRTKNASK